LPSPIDKTAFVLHPAGMMDAAKTSSPPKRAVSRGRLGIALAALLWSTSGAFTKVLTLNTGLGLNSPPIEPLQIAFYRVLFAGLVFLPMLRRRDLSFRPLMLGMAGCFALMNATFVSALALGTAANAIFLQYTAPMWMYLASVWWLGEPPDRRSFAALVIGIMGIGVIVWGGRQEAQLGVIAIALTSGFAYAGVIVFLRVLRDASPRWLTAFNHLAGAFVLLPWVCHQPLPTPGQFCVLIAYGAGQMALPYWLMARSLKTVSPQEAGTISLLEPLLNPLWAYLISGEQPSVYTLWGGAFILGALAWRYGPRYSFKGPKNRTRRNAECAD
jgi:DME family drug/metabolite transporter